MIRRRPPRSSRSPCGLPSGATAYADHLGLMPDLIARWPDLPKYIEDPLYAVAYLNPLALVAVHKGETDEARRLIAQAAAHGNTGTLRLAAAFGVAASASATSGMATRYLAEATLRAALARAEQEDGRRGMIASLYAPLLAAALLERDQPEAARTLLANRLDVIERTGFPDTILLAYRTLAHVALIQGDERRALSVLESLGALATRRQLPRLALCSLTEQIRIHALRACTETVSQLVRGPRSARRSLPAEGTSACSNRSIGLQLQSRRHTRRWHGTISTTRSSSWKPRKRSHTNCTAAATP